MVSFEEGTPKHGQTCRIVWSDWYAKQIGQEKTLVVYDDFKKGFFDGDKWILFNNGYPIIEVLIVD